MGGPAEKERYYEVNESDNVGNRGPEKKSGGPEIFISDCFAVSPKGDTVEENGSSSSAANFTRDRTGDLEDDG